MNGKLHFLKILKLFTDNSFLISQVTFMVLVILFVMSQVAIRLAFSKKYLAGLENSPIFIKELTSPTLAPRTAKVRIEIPTPEGVKRVVSKTSNPLCKDVVDFWVLVPDTAHEGQFVICNTVVEKMTTVDELNAAQNEYRRDHNLNTLSINPDLCKVAAERAREISVNFSHDGFETAIDRSGINKSTVGENIASGPLLGIHFVEWSWDRSPGHRANMLRDWTDGCAGVYDRFAVFIFAK